MRAFSPEPTGWVLTIRYFLPIAPALCLTAAWALIRITAPEADASCANGSPTARWRRAAGVLAIAVVVVPTYAWALAFSSIYTRPHTRIAASRWLYANLPWKVTLQVEGADGADAALPVAAHDHTTGAGLAGTGGNIDRSAGAGGDALSPISGGVLRSVRAGLTSALSMPGAPARVAVTVAAVDGGSAGLRSRGRPRRRVSLAAAAPPGGRRAGVRDWA